MSGMPATPSVTVNTALTRLPDQQIGQLYELMQATKKIAEDEAAETERLDGEIKKDKN